MTFLISHHWREENRLIIDRGLQEDKTKDKAQVNDPSFVHESEVGKFFLLKFYHSVGGCQDS